MEVSVGDKIQWHPAFYESALATFHDCRDDLVFESEHQLVSGPLEIDLLVIKKRRGVPIRKAVAEIFRGHNIIEYKNPEDSFSVDDFYKVYAYACLYKTLEKVGIDDLTLSFVLTGYPRELTRHLEQVRGYTVRERHPGVYDVRGDILPIQIIESKRLEGDENFWLRNLSAKLSAERLNDILQVYQDKGAEYNLNAYMFAVLKANQTVAEANMANMQTAVPEWVKLLEEIIGEDRLRAAVEKNVRKENARNALKKNLPIEDIADITGMSRQEIEQLRTDDGMAAQ
jgi:hypothetical protein